MTVKQTQCLLAYLGYDPGEVDGLDGPKTQAALAAFRQAEGADTEAALLDAVANGRFYTATEAAKTGTFWDKIRYFTREEPGIACPCGRCGGFPVEPTERLMVTADSIRAELGPMTPSSTVRCQTHNDELPGSAKNSRHVSGRAMDFSCPRSTAAQTEACLERKKQAGEIRYWYRMSDGWYHFDVE